MAMGALAGWITLRGQAADPQWKRSGAGDLLLYINGQDPGSGEIGEMLAKQLRKVLPESGARVAREPTAARVASVLSTEQGNLAVIAYDIALEMYRGQPPFQAVGPIELRVLVENYKYQVVCRADFRRDPGYLVAEALMKDPEPLKLTVPERPAARAGRDSIPTHPGALAFSKGEPLDQK
jgi:TRAP-type uncharacterized transport system substrate-binding protein